LQEHKTYLSVEHNQIQITALYVFSV